MKSAMQYDQYFLSYSGVSLPLNLVNSLSREEVDNRNTYFGVLLDGDGRISVIHQCVYGEVELSHAYGYNENGVLVWAEIRGVDEEGQRIEFEPSGKIISVETLDELGAG